MLARHFRAHAKLVRAPICSISKRHASLTRLEPLAGTPKLAQPLFLISSDSTQSENPRTLLDWQQRFVHEGYTVPYLQYKGPSDDPQAELREAIVSSDNPYPPLMIAHGRYGRFQAQTYVESNPVAGLILIGSYPTHDRKFTYEPHFPVALASFPPALTKHRPPTHRDRLRIHRLMKDYPEQVASLTLPDNGEQGYRVIRNWMNENRF